MPVHNADIAAAFRRLADLLEIGGENPFRVRAYRNAATTLSGLSRDAAVMLADGADLSELPGIGDDLAGKIAEMIGTGSLQLLEEIETRVPPGLSDMTRIPGLGPKRVRAIHEALGIDDIASLERAAKNGRLRALPGFGAKTEAKIVAEIGRYQDREKRLLLIDAEHIAEPLLAFIRRIDGVKRAVIAGSYRRQKETVGDLDILVTAKDGGAVIDRFVRHDEVGDIVSQGTTRSTVILKSGFQVDLRVVAEASYGAALFYFTGSKAHNIEVRKLAIKRGWKLNEYGLFEDDTRIAGRTEEEIYTRLALPFIAPQLRENRGEIEAAKSNALPELVTLEDMRGDLHCHTTASDGKYSVREMAEAARAKGYAWLGITDHSKSQTVAGGMSEDELAAQIEEIDALNEKLSGFRVLKSCEVDILPDGSLDFSDNLLARLDYTVCSIHGAFNLSREKQTARVLRAMDNPHFTILGHATGRLINRRPAYDIDLETVMQAARERGCYLELNAQPSRLDIDDIHCRIAKDIGLKVPISTDAHTLDGLEMMRFGIAQAGRGWLEAKDVLNTLPLEKLLKAFER